MLRKTSNFLHASLLVLRKPPREKSLRDNSCSAAEFHHYSAGTGPLPVPPASHRKTVTTTRSSIPLAPISANCACSSKSAEVQAFAPESNFTTGFRPSGCPWTRFRSLRFGPCYTRSDAQQAIGVHYRWFLESDRLPRKFPNRRLFPIRTNPVTARFNRTSRDWMPNGR